jgi:hypothetical protein
MLSFDVARVWSMGLIFKRLARRGHPAACYKQLVFTLLSIHSRLLILGMAYPTLAHHWQAGRQAGKISVWQLLQETIWNQPDLLQLSKSVVCYNGSILTFHYGTCIHKYDPFRFIIFASALA